MVSPQTRRRSVATVQYAVGLALLPLEPQYGVLVMLHHRAVDRLRPLTPAERLYVTAAVAIHTVGVTFPDQLYRGFAWYDDVTHFMSGSLVAGLLAAVLSRRVDRFRRLALLTLAALLVVGIGWEMYEYHTPRLRVYGWGDTVSDIWTNVVGGTAMLAYRRVRTPTERADATDPPSGRTDGQGLG